MLHRIRIDLAFTDQDPCNDIRDKALDYFSQAHTINPGQPDEEKGFIIIEECYHDQHPHLPCTITEQHFTP